MQITSIEMEEVYKHLRLQARFFNFGDEDCDDLASEAFTRGCERIDSFKFQNNESEARLAALKGWFSKIMKHMYIDKIKSADTQKVDRRISVDESMLASPALKPSEEAEKSDLAKKLWEVCAEILSPQEYKILLLSMSDNKYQEIADMLGISRNTVGSNISDAKLKLRKNLPDFEQLL